MANVHFHLLGGHGKSVKSSIGEDTNPVYSGISDNYVVPNQLFVENRLKLLEELRKVKPNSIVFLQGRRDKFWYNTGMKWMFKQEPCFLWLFGVMEPGFYGALDVQSKNSYLFFPQSESECVLCGEKMSAEALKIKYAVDVALPIKDMDVELSVLCRDGLLILGGDGEGRFPSSIPDFPTLDCFNVDYITLWPIMEKCRMIKGPRELDVIRYVSNVTNEGLRFLIKYMYPGMYAFQVESLFTFYVQYAASCKQLARLSRITTVENFIKSNELCKTGQHDEVIKDGEMVYIVSGASCHGYRLTLTATFPINRLFTDVQRHVHNIVTAMRFKVLENLKPTASLDELYNIACKTLIKELIILELLTGSPKEIISEGIADLFQVKPFFKMVGIDVHDVGQTFLEPSKQTTKIGDVLITETRKLEPGMTISLQFSCYFFKEKLNNEEVIKYQTCKIENYENQGTSIQDILYITDESYEVLSNHPITVQEIEGIRKEVDFRARKGKNIDIIEGRKLFPNASEIIKDEIKKVRSAFPEYNSI